MIIVRLIVCWAWVSLPLGWGFYQSVQKSLPLFGVETAKPAAAPVAPAAK